MANNAFATLSNYLTQIGLGSLFSVDGAGNPSGWLWDQIVGGVDTTERLQMALEQTPEFRKRFKIIFDMRDRVNKGEAVTVPKVDEVLKYEQQYRSVMSQAGVPAWFYDSFKDAHDAIRRNLTIEQIAQRIDTSYSVVTRMPQEVRDVFAQYFGDSTDASLVAAVLDPQKTLASLEKATRAAVGGGFARRQGFEITSTQAQEYAMLGKDLTQIQQDMTKVAEAQGLAQAQAGEAPLTEQPTDFAFQAQAMGDVGAQTKLQNRLITRQLGQAQSAGGALTSSQGVVGAGSAR